MCKNMEIAHTTKPVYHGQSDPTERVNRVLKTMIVSFLTKDHRDWDQHLPKFRFVYNTAVNNTLNVFSQFLNFDCNSIPYRSLRR